MFGSSKTSMVTPDRALPGRPTPAFTLAATNLVLGTPLTGPWPGAEVLYVAAGCFWGVEEMYWQLDGVVGTSVGYMGGFTPNPTYEEVCTGLTGHAEVVQVGYDPQRVSTEEILRLFWEHHDPTQGNAQGNDIGTQYRSALYVTTPEQRDEAARTRDAFQAVLTAAHRGAITTEIRDAAGLTYFPAEDYHQQYLHVRPNGYRCHGATGLRLPNPA